MLRKFTTPAAALINTESSVLKTIWRTVVTAWTVSFCVMKLCVLSVNDSQNKQQKSSYTSVAISKLFCCRPSISKFLRPKNHNCQLEVDIKIFFKAVTPRPTWGLGGMIRACWTKQSCKNLLWQKQNYVNMKAYNPPPPKSLKIHKFGAFNIYTVLGHPILPAFTAVEWITGFVYSREFIFFSVRWIFIPVFVFKCS